MRGLDLLGGVLQSAAARRCSPARGLRPRRTATSAARAPGAARARPPRAGRRRGAAPAPASGARSRAGARPPRRAPASGSARSARRSASAPGAGSTGRRSRPARPPPRARRAPRRGPRSARRWPGGTPARRRSPARRPRPVRDAITARSRATSPGCGSGSRRAVRARRRTGASVAPATADWRHSSAPPARHQHQRPDERVGEPDAQLAERQQQRSAAGGPRPARPPPSRARPAAAAAAPRPRPRDRHPGQRVDGHAQAARRGRHDEGEPHEQRDRRRCAPRSRRTLRRACAALDRVAAARSAPPGPGPEWMPWPASMIAALRAQSARRLSPRVSSIAPSAANGDRGEGAEADVDLEPVEQQHRSERDQRDAGYQGRDVGPTHCARAAGAGGVAGPLVVVALRAVAVERAARSDRRLASVPKSSSSRGRGAPAARRSRGRRRPPAACRRARPLRTSSQSTSTPSFSRPKHVHVAGADVGASTPRTRRAARSPAPGPCPPAPSAACRRAGSEVSRRSTTSSPMPSS